MEKFLNFFRNELQRNSFHEEHCSSFHASFIRNSRKRQAFAIHFIAIRISLVPSKNDNR